MKLASWKYFRQYNEMIIIHDLKKIISNKNLSDSMTLIKCNAFGRRFLYSAFWQYFFMIYGFYFICKLKKHQIITNILEKAETLPSKVSVFCEKKESEKSSRKKMPKILFSCTSLVSTFIELSTNNVISILKSKVYVI